MPKLLTPLYELPTNRRLYEAAVKMVRIPCAVIVLAWVFNFAIAIFMLSFIALLDWHEMGGLEGYLLTLPIAVFRGAKWFFPVCLLVAFLYIRRL